MQPAEGLAAQPAPRFITLCMGRADGQRALVARSAAEAAAALQLAGETPVLLLSAPGAAASLGPAGWLALVAAARAAAPEATARDALCCGDGAGHALAALRAGCRLLVLDPACPAYAAVAAAANECGAVLLPQRPAALDLTGLDLRRPGGRALLMAWLAADAPAPDDSGGAKG
ncbi:hypothetical protein DFH01_21070 [Falsiroseomonas bella]|uniref:Uncharacterized protein n=1 Tax=Falsiroseomonas bella TaxID=2184016 RepID=A0A317FAA5_9PROT|nr:hypothetical protein [Falsiroseomonas bella]PWS34849.1 hypothetical protein DFH01_21070 [Falsiroseomonas bella]